MQRPAELFEAPEFGEEGILFTLKEISYSPLSPRMKEPFTVKGKIDLFKIPFIGPLWVIATVTYPETWWEEIIPIWGSPEVRESDTALGGNFEVTFKKGFEREGEFSLAVRAYAGPTMFIDKITLPPFPAVATEETTFTVGGEVPPEELGFRNFKVLSYSKNGGTPVTPPSVLDLNVGDKLRINVGFEHMEGAVSAGLYGAIGNLHKIPTEWFDEVLKGETAISVPASADWKPYSAGYYVEIPITSAIAPGTYSIYAKIIRITGGDIISPYLENVITIAGGAPPEAAWEMVEEVLGIVVEAAAPVEVWQMVEEVSGIVVEAGAEVSIWLMVQEVSGIIVEAAPEVSVWQMVQEVSGIVVEVALPPAKKPPEIETLPATNITHNSVTLSGELIEEGFCSVIMCYIEWGKTTSYGDKSPERRLYPGQALNVDISGLTPATTYHFRGVAVGRCVTPELVGYGNDRTFKTAAEVVKGFQMRVTNPPSGAVYWLAGCVLGGTYPYMKTTEPLDYVWKWTKAVPGITLRFFVVATGAEEDGYWPTVQYDEFDFLLRDGKKYVWNFATHKMTEE